MNNNNPKSEKLTFCGLISEHRIEIPIMQRDYAQGRDGKEELRKDFLTALLNAIKEKPIELDFVYGSVKDNVFQPLDGQQRLTTLFLLHWFVAVKEKKLDDELKNLLKKFTYETRISSREFCEALVTEGIDHGNLLETDYHDKEKTNPKNNELSKTIIDSPWFFLSWKKDPTIKSMLTMLDDIQQIFQGETEIWDGLNNISFHYIKLQNFGLSDDLYIKMNARGKSLTDFENFKAKFEQHIKENGWESNVTSEETFSHKIDTDWADLFWNYRDEKNVFDNQLMNFFRTMAIMNYTLKADIKNNNFRTNVELLRGNQPISFNQYLELGCFDMDYFKMLKSVLNKVSDKSGLKTFLSDTTYADEKEIFNGVIKNNLVYADLVIAFAYYRYLAEEETVEKEKLESWLRIVRNLVEGTRPYLFNDANDFANALRSINELLSNRNSIVKHLTETQSNSLSGFIIEQVSEEKTKAQLITKSDDWKNAIIEIENHGYFNGQIGFLLDWCKDENEEHNIDKFKEYTEKVKAIFDENGLKNFDEHLFERALLAKGNYLLKKNSNHSFLIDSERDISWKRLLRDNNNQRNVLKSLFDIINQTALIQDLEKIVKDFSNEDDWRYYFIKQPEMISACGTQKLVRFNDENEFDILLLSSTMTSGFHKEYYSYSLFVALKEKLSLDETLYKDQRSVEYWKHFELNDKQIAFDCNSQKYVFLEKQDEDWEIKQELGDREKAISELTKA